MTYIKNNYIARRISGGLRNWFIVKADNTISLSKLHLSKEFVGKHIRIRIKVEVIDDNELMISQVQR